MVTQVLVKTADGHGRKAICEIMVMTKAIAKLIQTDQTHQIPTQLQMGTRPRHAAARPGAAGGHQRAKEVDPDDAYGYATEKRAFQRFVTDTSMLPKLDMTGTAPVAATPPTAPSRG